MEGDRSLLSDLKRLMEKGLAGDFYLRFREVFIAATLAI
jgi:hypothetical protein